MIGMLCGAVVGLTHFAIGQPLDYIKVSYQVSQNNNSTLSKIKSGLTDKLKGITKYYSGGSSSMLGLPVATAVQFGVYEQIKSNFAGSYKHEYGQTPE